MPARRRTKDWREGRRHLRWGQFSNPYPTSSPADNPDPAYYTEDLQESHGHPYHKLGKDPGDIGGDFRVVKHEYHEGKSSEPNDFSIVKNNPYAPGHHYKIGQYAFKGVVGSADFPVSGLSSKGTLNTLGTTAIARCTPTNPLAGLSVALGELREGIPKLVGASTLHNRAQVARSAGSEYLNVQFGWLPLVNDVKALNTSMTNSDELIRKYEANSGKRLKRRYEFPTVKTIEVVNQGLQNAVPLMTIPNGYYYGDSRGIRTRTTTFEKKQWFEGCFTYYLPPYDPHGNNSKRNRQIRNYLYGTRITPETLWDLTPWSWAADWFGNMGDVLQNVSSFANDGLVMPYGYMMESVTTSVSYLLSGQTYWSYYGKKFVYTQTFTTRSKQRVRATPYGFGLNIDSFTNRQKAIILALGLSRS